MGSEGEKARASGDEARAEFKLDTFVDAMREANNEVLQVEELRSHTEKLKEDLIGYVTDILRDYNLTLKVPAKSLPDAEGVRTVSFNGTGIISFHLQDGSVKSQAMREFPPHQLLNLLSAAMPHLRAALMLKRKEFEELSNLLSKIGKHILPVKKAPADPQKQHAL